MATAKDFFSQLGSSASFGDRLDAVRVEHGRGASRWLADQLGVSMRTAQRYLAGTQRPGRSTSERLGQLDRATNRRIAANRIRQLHTVTPGTVAVDSTSPKGAPQPDGLRNMNRPLSIGVAMDAVADAYARGDDDAAARLFDDAIMAAYAGEDPTDNSGLASTLQATDYRDGISYT